MRAEDNLLEDFNFFSPTKIEYGPGKLDYLAEGLSQLGVKRALLVTDSGVREAGLTERVEGILAQAEIEYRTFEEVEPNPKDYNVHEGAGIGRAFEAEALVALGGGSVIDCAKGIEISMAYEGESITDFGGSIQVNRATPALVAIPTTAGTGSEVTFSSVITDTEKGFKTSIRSPEIAPDLALIDPDLTETLPPKVAASTGVDALTHAIEAFTVDVATPLSDALALRAIELIGGNLREAVFEKTDRARAALSLGSLLAGAAFNNSDVGSVHCMAEALGGLYDAPHGICNSVLLPHVMEYNRKYRKTRYARIARALGGECESEEDCSLRAVRLVEDLVEAMKLPSLKSLGLKERDLKQLAAMAAENLSTESNPRPMSEEDYLNLFERVLQKEES